MITTLTGFVDYFRTLATEHQGINDFVLGGSHRILHRENEQLNYPVLWITYPDLTARGSGEDGRADFTFQLFVLDTTGNIDSWDKIDANMNDTLLIMKDLIRRMIHDSEQDDNPFQFNYENAVLQPKTAWSGDNDHGWVLDFNLLTNFNLCYDPQIFS